MPRQARIDFPGALHHIIVRGIERKPIFRDDEDRVQFLKRLGVQLTNSQTNCYAYLPEGEVHVVVLDQVGNRSEEYVVVALPTTFKAIVKYKHGTLGYVPIPEGVNCTVTKIRPNVVYLPAGGSMGISRDLEEIIKFCRVKAGGVVEFNFNKTGNDDVVSYRIILDSYMKGEGNSQTGFVTVGKGSSIPHVLVSDNFAIYKSLVTQAWEPLTGEVIFDNETIAIGTDGYFNTYHPWLSMGSMFNVIQKIPNYPGVFSILELLRANYDYMKAIDNGITVAMQSYHPGSNHSRYGTTAYDPSDGIRKICTNAAGTDDEWNPESITLAYGSWLANKYTNTTGHFMPDWGNRATPSQSFINGFCYAYAAIKEENPNVSISGSVRDISAGGPKGIDNESAVAKMMYELNNTGANIFPSMWSDIRTSPAISNSFSSIDEISQPFLIDYPS